MEHVLLVPWIPNHHGLITSAAYKYLFQLLPPFNFISVTNFAVTPEEVLPLVSQTQYYKADIIVSNANTELKFIFCIKVSSSAYPANSFKIVHMWL